MDNQQGNNNENTERQAAGFSQIINLSKDHERYVKAAKQAGASSNKEFLLLLLDNFENPPTNADNATVIANLEKQVANLQAENAAYDATQQNNEAEINQLKIDLAAARNEANDNAARMQSIELANQGCIIIKPNPVVAYFLQEMAKETGKSPADILQALYIDDLQNPRANNLPYTVESSRIREVMDELKPQQN